MQPGREAGRQAGREAGDKTDGGGGASLLSEGVIVPLTARAVLPACV